MKPQEVEFWAREIIEVVIAKKRVEESRVELKAAWINADRAAPRLAGHANAARGENILWLMGVDDRNGTVTGVGSQECGSWFRGAEKYFDGSAPRLLVDVNVRVEDKTVVALYFETAFGAPYVVKNPSGGYPEFTVPWRVGTDIRAARREDLLRVLVPIRRLSSLLGELEFNYSIASAHPHSTSSPSFDTVGCPFRDEEFRKAMQDGAIATLQDDVKELVTKAYIGMGRANQLISQLMNQSMGAGSFRVSLQALSDSVKRVRGEIEAALDALRQHLSSDNS